MHKSEPRANPTLITHANKVYELRAGPLGPIGILAFLESNSKVDSTSHYKESIKLQYPM